MAKILKGEEKLLRIQWNFYKVKVACYSRASVCDFSVVKARFRKWACARTAAQPS